MTVSLFADFFVQIVDLFAVKQEFAAADRPVIHDIAMGILPDVCCTATLAV